MGINHSTSSGSHISVAFVWHASPGVLIEVSLHRSLAAHVHRFRLVAYRCVLCRLEALSCSERTAILVCVCVRAAEHGALDRVLSPSAA